MDLKVDEKKLGSYCNVKEYAEKIGVTKQTVYNMIEDGRVESINVGGLRLVKLKS